MSKTVTTLDQRSSVALPPEALDALGVEAGSELEVEIVGRALLVRSVEEARRSREFINAFESILSRRRSAYEELAKGPEQQSSLLMKFPEKLDVLTVHVTLIAETDGTNGLRDEALLESAHHLTQTHAFLDGNKRVAAAITEAFLETVIE